MRITPYQMLMEEFKEFADKVVYAKRRIMWTWDKNDIHEKSWRLHVLYERTVAAQQLGYEVVLKANADKNELRIEYIEKRPDEKPWRTR